MMTGPGMFSESAAWGVNLPIYFSSPFTVRTYAVITGINLHVEVRDKVVVIFFVNPGQEA